jgi:uncharacterized protein
LLKPDAAEISLGDYLAQNGYSRQFSRNYILPMGAAIWSASTATMLGFPARYFVRFFHNHGMLSVDQRPQWRTIAGGSARYAEKLVAPFRDRIRLNAAVESVQRTPAHVLVKPQWGEAERFDAVFFACHSDQALRMLADPTPVEREVLGVMHYQDNDVVLHTDTSVLPKRKLAWAAWNYHLLNQETDRVAVTYNMNNLQSLGTRTPLLVTLNMTDAIDPAKIIKRLNYSHPMYTQQSVAAQARQAEVNADRTFFCGAYWRYGFHEDGVVSALNALAHFKERVHAQRHFHRAG